MVRQEWVDIVVLKLLPHEDQLDPSMLRDEGYLLWRASGVERYADSPYRHQSQLGDDALHHVLRVECHTVARLDASAYECLRCQHSLLG